MAKKKGGLSERVLSKKKVLEKKVNPFEVKLNKQKHDVLGKKLSKFDRGAPGLSRSKALKKRKDKLLKEYQQKDSANVFLDKRLGENDPTLSVEEKMTQRFALEKKRSHEKGSLFNLDEDIELTHYGQSLQEMEKFEAPDISDDELDAGNLDASFVSEELFGGFLKKSDQNTEEKPWKERLQEIISKSKKAKHERQTERDQTIEMTEKLDEQWKELQLLVAGSKRGSKLDEPTQKADDYDIAVRELQFELKGTASDRLKSEEEIAKDEIERLQKLEADRQRRMRGELEDSTQTQTHPSADDLNDCYALDKTHRSVLKYKDGKMCLDEIERDNSDDENECVEDVIERDVPDKLDVSEEEDSSGEEEKDSSGEEDGDSEGSEEEDNYTDLEESDADVEESQPELKSKSREEKTKGTVPKKNIDLKARKQVMDAARKELPYTFEVPTSVEGLLSLLSGHTVSDQITIIHRMKQCHHPSLAEGNKDKLEQLFSLLLEYIGKISEFDPPQLEVINLLTPDLYDLCKMSPVKCGQAMLEVIKAHQENIQQMSDNNRLRGFPTLVVLIHLKLVSTLFPTSDFRHPVVTPSMLFISQLLSQCQVTQERDAAAGLFLTTLVYEYVTSSRRYFPEAINFLRGLLFLAAEKSDKKVEAVIPPFKPIGKNIDLLKIQKTKLSGVSVNETISLSKTLSSHLDKSSLDTDEFRLSVVCCCLDLCLEFSRLYEEMPSHTEIFQPLLYMMEKLPKAVKNVLQDKINAIKVHMNSIKSKPRIQLLMQSKKPQPMKQFEPKIETIFDGKKKRSGGDKEYNERQRLIHKHKREMKGAIREIRRDVQFIGREQLNMTIQKDQERKRKVQDIHQMLAEQEGDFKALKRKKDKL